MGSSLPRYPRCRLTERDLELARHFSKASSLGRADHTARQGEEYHDRAERELDGCLGEAAGYLFMEGATDRYWEEQAIREMGKKFNLTWDGIFDGLKYDFKTSHMTAQGRTIGEYHLWVVPRQFHKDLIYANIMLARGFYDPDSEDFLAAHFGGWSWASEIPLRQPREINTKNGDKDQFGGKRYELHNHELHHLRTAPGKSDPDWMGE